MSSYLDQMPGMGIGPGGLGQQANLNEIYGRTVAGRALSVSEMAEMEMKERENRRRMWLDNMPDTARSLDYIRRQLIDADMQAEAKAIDGVIVAMINRWNEDRAKHQW